MARKSGSKRKTEKAPAIDKLMLPAIGVGIALLAYQFFQGLGKEIQRIDLSDELQVKTVFENVADNERYVVLCHPEDAKYPLSSVFMDAHKEVSSTVNFKIVDCESKSLDNGKSIVEEYGSGKKNKLDVKKRPTIFVTNPLQQIPTKHLKTGHFLAKALRNLLEKRANKVETTQDLRGAKCLSKDVCGLLLKGTKSVDSATKKAYHRLMEEFPQVEFAAVDATNLYVWNLEDQLPEPAAGQHRFVVFKKVSGSTKDKDKGRLITSMAQLRGSVSHLSMSNLVTDVLNGSVQPQKLSSLPMIKTRTKKVLQEEAAKRERRKNAAQQNQAAGAGGGRDATPAGMFADNDGSREGRRAERERRRQEHYQKTGFKPKTPEEQAEMERKRRMRMEEEAAKWNMAPDDAPPEGEKSGEGATSQEFVEEEEYYIDEDGDYYEQQEEDEDEEIIDLD